MEVALVTGAAIRVGREIAIRLAAESMMVCLHCNKSEDAAHALAADIKAKGGNAAVFQTALEEPGAPMQLVSEIERQIGPVSCLINNASLFEDDRLSSMSVAAWDAHMAVNARAPVFLGQAMAAALPDKQKGNIVNIIDQRVWRLNPQYFSYTVSKAALWTATQTMAQALAPRIRVNAIGPGPVLRSIHQTAEDFEHERSAMPLGNGASPEQIADTVMFILRAPAMTGQMIALDGGQHLMWQTPDIRVT